MSSSITLTGPGVTRRVPAAAAPAGWPAAACPGSPSSAPAAAGTRRPWRAGELARVARITVRGGVGPAGDPEPQALGGVARQSGRERVRITAGAQAIAQPAVEAQQPAGRFTAFIPLDAGQIATGGAGPVQGGGVQDPLGAASVLNPDRNRPGQRVQPGPAERPGGGSCQPTTRTQPDAGPGAAAAASRRRRPPDRTRPGLSPRSRPPTRGRRPRPAGARGDRAGRERGPRPARRSRARPVRAATPGSTARIVSGPTRTSSPDWRRTATFLIRRVVMAAAPAGGTGHG